MTDLRGYGDSSKPSGGGDHFAYSKRAMALDQVEVMTKLGFEKFALIGHDRRAAHRLALDHPDRLIKLVILDIVPRRLCIRILRRFCDDFLSLVFACTTLSVSRNHGPRQCRVFSEMRPALAWGQ
jgi:pimeloyl-ACP methyl ester carboxylesterase